MKTNHNVLLVDDDRTFTPLVQEYLTAKGMDVAMKHNGDDGLSAFLAGDFDLCVLDVKMPMKDGFTLAQEIRERDAKVPFIFLSAQTEKESRIKGLLLGADDYITKPFSMEELYLRIAAVLRRVGQQQQQRSETPLLFEIGKYR
ncbi:MAG TPA: response regulator transcription factor, partial [Bacteroidetes bacterium]|nr:response regulator transcription factor [Bacteroidota bacterium]